MVFQNVSLDNPNFSFGPTPGQVYTINQATSVMTVKTYPAGTVATSLPLSDPIQNPVVSLEYDGFYFYSLSAVGLAGDLGYTIQKWQINNTGTILTKISGIGNEIQLNNTANRIIDSRAFAVRKYSTTLNFFVGVGSNFIDINSTTELAIGDSIYLGPSSAGAGEREAFTVTNISGTTVTLNRPTIYQYNLGDQVIYRKDTYLFNNYNGITRGGRLLRISQNNGLVVGNFSGEQWFNVQSASSKDGKLVFIKDSQYLEYRPLGVNAGFTLSLALENKKIDHNTLIEVFDLEVDSDAVYKLQLEQHIYNDTLLEYVDEDSVDGKFQIQQEFFVPTVFSISILRDRALLLGDQEIEVLTFQVLDQYNTPVFNRSFQVTEDDPFGSITGGFESFTTDVFGQGVSEYNTNLILESNQVLISVRDSITDFRQQFSIDQKALVNMFAFLNQQLAVNSSFLEQTSTTNKSSLNQYIAGSLAGLEQRQIENLGAVEQVQARNTHPIDQNITVNKSQITQKPSVESTVNINQFSFLIFAVPVPFSIKNPVDTDILIRISQFGSIALVPSTLIFKVNGIEVSSQVTITPFTGGLELFYDPPINFGYGETVSVEIEIEDENLPSNVISTSYTFNTVEDTKAPFFIEVFPANLSEGNLISTPIFAIIQDNETSIDLDSIIMYVEGQEVTPTITSINNNNVRVFYQPSCNFGYNQEVNVAVEVADEVGNSYLGSWRFTTEESQGVLFTKSTPENCSKLIPLNQKICIEVFGQEAGIDTDSLELDINLTEVSFVLVPKVYRRN